MSRAQPAVPAKRRPFECEEVASAAKRPFAGVEPPRAVRLRGGVIVWAPSRCSRRAVRLPGGTIAWRAA